MRRGCIAAPEKKRARAEKDSRRRKSRRRRRKREKKKAGPREIAGQWNRYIMAPTPALAALRRAHTTHTHIRTCHVLLL